MKRVKKISVYVAVAVALIYLGDVIGYNTSRSESTQLRAELTKAQAAANDTSKSYDALLATHNDLVSKWNQQQKDITDGKYTRTQYVQGPTQYVSTYTSPIRCNTQYYTYLSSSSTTCY